MKEERQEIKDKIDAMSYMIGKLIAESSDDDDARAYSVNEVVDAINESMDAAVKKNTTRAN